MDLLDQARLSEHLVAIFTGRIAGTPPSTLAR